MTSCIQDVLVYEEIRCLKRLKLSALTLSDAAEGDYVLLLSIYVDAIKC